jgi:transcriptional regulator with XRE-family HTH domain
MNRDDDVSFDPRELRLQLGLNQQEFWSAVGVTQSGGSRYENDRRISRPVMELLRLRYLLNIDIQLISEENSDIIRAVANGEMDSKFLAENAARIQKVIAAMSVLEKDVVNLSRAADELINRPGISE